MVMTCSQAALVWYPQTLLSVHGRESIPSQQIKVSGLLYNHGHHRGEDRETHLLRESLVPFTLSSAGFQAKDFMDRHLIHSPGSFTIFVCTCLGDRVSCSPGWPQSHSVADDLELLILPIHILTLQVGNSIPGSQSLLSFCLSFL